MVVVVLLSVTMPTFLKSQRVLFFFINLNMLIYLYLQPATPTKPWIPCFNHRCCKAWKQPSGAAWHGRPSTWRFLGVSVQRNCWNFPETSEQPNFEPHVEYSNKFPVISWFVQEERVQFCVDSTALCWDYWWSTCSICCRLPWTGMNRRRDMHVWPIWLRSAYLSTCMDRICSTTCLNVECQRCELVWLELMPSYSDIRLTSLQQRSQIVIQDTIFCFSEITCSWLVSLKRPGWECPFHDQGVLWKQGIRNGGKINGFLEGHHQSTRGLLEFVGLEIFGHTGGWQLFVQTAIVTLKLTIVTTGHCLTTTSGSSTTSSQDAVHGAIPANAG